MTKQTTPGKKLSLSHKVKSVAAHLADGKAQRAWLPVFAGVPFTAQAMIIISIAAGPSLGIAAMVPFAVTAGLALSGAMVPQGFYDGTLSERTAAFCKKWGGQISLATTLGFVFASIPVNQQMREMLAQAAAKAETAQAKAKAFDAALPRADIVIPCRVSVQEAGVLSKAWGGTAQEQAAAQSIIVKRCSAPAAR